MPRSLARAPVSGRSGARAPRRCSRTPSDFAPRRRARAAIIPSSPTRRDELDRRRAGPPCAHASAGAPTPSSSSSSAAVHVPPSSTDTSTRSIVRCRRPGHGRARPAGPPRRFPLGRRQHVGRDAVDPSEIRVHCRPRAAGGRRRAGGRPRIVGLQRDAVHPLDAARADVAGTTTRRARRVGRQRCAVDVRREQDLVAQRLSIGTEPPNGPRCSHVRRAEEGGVGRAAATPRRAGRPGERHPGPLGGADRADVPRHLVRDGADGDQRRPAVAAHCTVAVTAAARTAPADRRATVPVAARREPLDAVSRHAPPPTSGLAPVAAHEERAHRVHPGGTSARGTVSAFSGSRVWMRQGRCESSFTAGEVTACVACARPVWHHLRRAPPDRHPRRGPRGRRSPPSSGALKSQRPPSVPTAHLRSPS